MCREHERFKNFICRQHELDAEKGWLLCGARLIVPMNLGGEEGWVGVIY